MAKEPHLHPADFVGCGRLATDATLGVTDMVEALHRQLAPPPGGQDSELATDITTLVYNSIRGVTAMVGAGFTVATPLLPSTKPGRSSREHEAVVAALNGVVGDYLARTNNPLAISMSLRRRGRPLDLERDALLSATSRPTGKALLLAHGLCLNDLQWQRKKHNHGAALARELGYTPVYLHYNSGLHVSENGAMLACLVERLLERWPVTVQELTIIGHSMGGLVSRSACQYGAEAGHHWPRHLRRVIFLGTPHHGAALERIGNWANTMLEISSYTAPFASLGKIRSAGITDMRHGNLLEQDWKGRDRFELGRDVRAPLPLPAGVECFAIAATKRQSIGDSSTDVLGDGLVPVNSALGRHCNPQMNLAFPESHQSIFGNMNHWDLLSHPAVYGCIRNWLD